MAGRIVNDFVLLVKITFATGSRPKLTLIENSNLTVELQLFLRRHRFSSHV